MSRFGQHRLDIWAEEIEARLAALSGGAGAQSGMWERIGPVITASASNEIDFVLPAGYIEFRARFVSPKPSNNDVRLLSQISNNGGSTFIAGGGYKSTMYGADSLGTVKTEFGNAIGNWRLTLGTTINDGVGNAADEEMVGVMHIINALDATRRTRFRGQVQYTAANNNEITLNNGGEHVTAETHDAIRFRFEAGTVISGDLILEGLLA